MENSILNKVKETEWTLEETFGTKDLDGPGYLLLKITEDGKGEITEGNPGYIRVRK